MTRRLAAFIVKYWLGLAMAIYREFREKHVAPGGWYSVTTTRLDDYTKRKPAVRKRKGRK